MSETVTNGATVDITEDGDVKPEIKTEFKPDFQFKDVKDEPADLEEEGKTSGRRPRKTKKASLAEVSDSGDSEDNGPPKKKGRQSTGKKATPKSKKGGAANGIDSTKSPRVVLQNIDAEIEKGSPTPKAGRGRGTPKATRGKPKGPASAAKGKGRGRGKAPSPEPEPEEEEDDGEDYQEENESEEEEDIADLTDESEDEWAGAPDPKKKKGRQSAGRGKGGGGRSAKKGRAENEPEPEPEDEEEEDEMPAANDATVNDLSGPVRTGQFMIEKTDLKRQENFPIWRMEGPNMLRKFEMLVIDGKVRHKSLYAYSSWAQTMLDLYTRIQVQQLSSADGEITVEVKEGYEPKPPSVEELKETYAEDELLGSYKPFIKALFNQVVNAKFLADARDNGDSTYLDPISKIDTMVCQVVKRIESDVNMKEEFMTRVKNCPNMKSIKRQNWSQTDQATVDKVTEKGVRSILMYGYGYDPFLMTEDSSRGVEVAQEIIIGATMEKYLASYHGLIHFKFNLLRRCEDKIKMEKGINSSLSEEQVLDKCLEDEGWILQTFEHLKTLMAV